MTDPFDGDIQRPGHDLAQGGQRPLAVLETKIRTLSLAYFLSRTLDLVERRVLAYSIRSWRTSAQ